MAARLRSQGGLYDGDHGCDAAARCKSKVIFPAGRIQFSIESAGGGQDFQLFPFTESFISKGGETASRYFFYGDPQLVLMRAAADRIRAADLFSPDPASDRDVLSLFVKEFIA